MEEVVFVRPVAGLRIKQTLRCLRYVISYAAYVEKMTNRMRDLEVQSADIERQRPNMPAHVRGPWLEEVEKIKEKVVRIWEDVNNIPRNNIGCFNFTKKYLAGRNADMVAMDIDRLIRYDPNKNSKQKEDINETRYKNLKREEDKAIFLLCGMFPKDSNIPIEDLTRYAWGLELLEQVSTMAAARDSIETSVSNLKKAKLLMDEDTHHSDFVKLDDLVLKFVVNTVSKDGEEGWWIIHHDDFSKLSEANNMNQSCKQISLTCKGVSKFPSEFKFPNLRVLKLVQGDEPLTFPQGVYEGMKELQVIAFENLKLGPTVLFSHNIRTLCLHECSLNFDLTCIGNLSNLEVLSFAKSSVEILPSTFGQLKKLRLLDVTGCNFDLVIKDGVLEGLVKLEELYMIPDEKTCRFTNNNSREFAERSYNLKRFKLSVECSSTQVREHVQTYKVDMRSYENILKLVTNTKELLESKINELFKITNALYLQVNDMNILEDVVVLDPPHPPQNSSFYNLRLLVVSQCAELKYLFTPIVATNLSKIEYLDISGCRNMEAVIHTENEGLDIIMFPKLKYVRLAELPKLLHFCNSVDVIEMSCLTELQLEGLPKFTSIYPDSATSFVSSNISSMQSFLNKEDVTTTKLEKLFVKDCDSIEVLFNMDFGEIKQFSSGLRSIKVDGCNSLKKLFSCNPFPFFNNLQELDVRRCSIQVLFEIDSARAGRYEEQVCSSSLRSITVERCNSLVKLFSCNPFPFLNNLQELNVKSCGSIQVLFNTESEEQVCSSSLRSIKVSGCDSIVNLLPSNPMPLFNNLEELEVFDCASAEVIFDINMGFIGEMDKVSRSRLRRIHLEKLGKLIEVWRIEGAGNNLIHGFEDVESILIRDCERFENLITPAITTFDMRALKEFKILDCGKNRGRNNELVESNQEINAMCSNDEISEIAFDGNEFH